RRIADDHPAIACNRWNRKPAPIWQRLRPIADHLSTFEQLCYERMPLELLQNALRIKTRVRIIQARNESQRHHVVLATVNPSAAVFARGQRPPHRVDDLTSGNPT